MGIFASSIVMLRSLSHFASKYKGPSSIGYRERGSHARGVYRTQGTSRMGKARVRQNEETAGYQNNCKRVVRNLDERNVETKRKSRKQDLTITLRF